VLGLGNLSFVVLLFVLEELGVRQAVVGDGRGCVPRSVIPIFSVAAEK
jgi:hypothetical protein